MDRKITMGMEVEIELIDRSAEIERLVFTLVENEKADFQAGFLGVGTPLAKTILGHVEGDTLDYTVGGLRSIKILSVRVSNQVQVEDVTARREAVFRKALKHSDYVNALNFSTSVNSKWGDYDIDSLDPDQWEPDK